MVDLPDFGTRWQDRRIVEKMAGVPLTRPTETPPETVGTPPAQTARRQERGTGHA